MLLVILNLQMTRLVLLMIRPRPTDRSQDIETELPVRFRVLELLDLERREPIQLIDGADLGVVALQRLVPERPGREAPEQEGLDAGVEDAAVETERGVEGWPHISDLPEFPPDGRFSQLGLVVVEEDGAAFAVGWRAGCQGREGGFGCKHPAPHGRVGALDLGHVEEAGCVADEGAAGECALGDGLIATFVQSAGGVGDALAAFEDGGVSWVVLHLLELAIGREPRVLVVEADDEADAYEIVIEVIHPAAAVGLVG